MDNLQAIIEAEIDKETERVKARGLDTENLKETILCVAITRVFGKITCDFLTIRQTITVLSTFVAAVIMEQGEDVRDKESLLYSFLCSLEELLENKGIQEALKSNTST